MMYWYNVSNSTMLSNAELDKERVYKQMKQAIFKWKIFMISWEMIALYFMSLNTEQRRAAAISWAEILNDLWPLSATETLYIYLQFR